MNFKEIFKVSGIVAVAVTIVQVLIGTTGPNQSFRTIVDTASLIGGIIVTNFILNKRLKNEEWSMLVGTMATIFIYSFLILFLDILGLQ